MSSRRHGRRHITDATTGSPPRRSVLADSRHQTRTGGRYPLRAQLPVIASMGRSSIRFAMGEHDDIEPVIRLRNGNRMVRQKLAGSGSLSADRTVRRPSDVATGHAGMIDDLVRPRLPEACDDIHPVYAEIQAGHVAADWAARRPSLNASASTDASGAARNFSPGPFPRRVEAASMCCRHSRRESLEMPACG